MNTEQIVKELRKMLPPKEDYAELVASPVPSSYGQYYVWQDPEPYIINEAADLIESLQAQLSKLEKRIAYEGFPDLETMISKYKTVLLAANEIGIETGEEIESLQAQLAVQTKRADEWRAIAAEEQQKALESQRRERAAVECRERAMYTATTNNYDVDMCCMYCKYGPDGTCEGDGDCKRCSGVSINKRGGWEFDYDRWRGPVAGEGEVE